MGWRVLNIKSVAKVELKQGKIAIRNEDKTNLIHISEIDTVIIENTAVSITASALNELINNKINIVFCDEKRNPASILVALHGAHDSCNKIRLQIAWDKYTKDIVWAEIVRAKINQQIIFLNELNKLEREKLFNYVNDIQIGDKTNREAIAAKEFFYGLYGTSFSRSQDNSINAALNYGYSIILSAFTREIVYSGYLTQLGIHHDNTFNPYNLACDFMEPYRVLVDRKVYAMQPEKFDKDEKTPLINILNDEVMIDNKKQYVSNAIQIYTRSLFDAINEKDISLIKNYKGIYEF